MVKRQWRSNLERLDSNVASHFAHDRQGEQFTHEELLIVRQLWYNDFEKVVVFSRYQMTSDDLRHLYDSSLKKKSMLVCVPINFNTYKH